MKKFRTEGRAERWWWRDTEKQEGEDGCRRAQERAVWRGVAGEVMGDIGRREGGRGFGWLGIRMGDMNGLEGNQWRIGGIEWEVAHGQLRREISARLSIMVSVLGQGWLMGYDGGRRWT